MDVDQITTLSFGFVVVWTAAVVLYALWSARDAKWEPAPPEKPEHQH